ncbi:MAG TPA: C4-type zinc ribbon domain-containing protein [Anaerolineae bacterium]|nr:C4-type zinc ribbon domain-containing protein [Anaerolineae bacterium]
MAHRAQKLYHLQALDLELSEKRSRLRKAKGLLGESPELIAAHQEHEGTTKECADWRSRLQHLELDLVAINDRIAATERRLYGGQVTNPKELGALQQDRDYSTSSRDRLEDDVLQAMTRLEDCQAAAAKASELLTVTTAQWQEQQAMLAGQIEALESSLAKSTEDRPTLAATIGADDTRLYEDLRHRKGGRAVALLVGHMCQGCRVTVPTNKAQQARRGTELVTCATCGRILCAEQ